MDVLFKLTTYLMPSPENAPPPGRDTARVQSPYTYMHTAGGASVSPPFFLMRWPRYPINSETPTGPGLIRPSYQPRTQGWHSPPEKRYREQYTTVDKGKILLIRGARFPLMVRDRILPITIPKLS
jgi:hypothetical protein